MTVNAPGVFHSWLLSIFLLVTGPLFSQGSQPDPPIAERGGAEIYVSDLDGLIMELPERVRGGYLDDPDRIQTTLSNLLLERQTAAVIAQFEAQRVEEANRNERRDYRQDRELAHVVRTHYIEGVKRNLPDFSESAFEEYTANKQKYYVKEQWTFRHVLIKEDNRTQEDARSRAEEVRRLLLQGTLPDDMIVRDYTDERVDGEVSDGYLEHVRPEMMVPELEAAFKLTRSGQVSDVLKSTYGYHVVRLLSWSTGRQLSFEEAKQPILDSLKDKYIRRKTGDFDDNLRNQPIKVDPALVLSLRTRYRDAGKGVIAPIVAHSGLIDPRHPP